MTLQKSNPNYVYWNDVNELVERLETLVASGIKIKKCT